MVADLDNGGVRLVFEVTGSGPTLLFLNGAGDARGTWDEVIAGLQPGCRCVTMDMRGQGQSDRAAGAYTVAHYTSDAVAVLDFLGEPAVLVGHSLGAITAFQVATTQHRSVRGIFLEDPPLYLGDADAFASTPFPGLFRWMRQELSGRQAAGASVAALAELIAGHTAPDGRITREVWTPAAIDAAASSWAQWDLANLDAALDGSLFEGLQPDKTLPCPAVVLQSDPSLGAAFRPQDADRFLSHNPAARVVSLEGADHCIHASRAFQARLVEELRSFVASLG